MHDVRLVAVADRLHNLRTLRPMPPPSRHRAALDTLTFPVPLANEVSAPGIAAEMTDLACAVLDAWPPLT